MSCLPDLDKLPLEILESSRAVVWNYETRDGQPTKVPYQAHRPTVKASVSDPSTWGRFDQAVATVQSGKAEGCGIVLGDGLVGIDLDDCRDPETGELAPVALPIIRKTNSYTEISVSGGGLHVLVHGELPPGGRRTNGLELYSESRYFVVTGQHLEGTPATIEERTPELAALHAEYFGAKSSSSTSPSSRPVHTTSLDDIDLLTLARHASNGVTFSALWAGDASAYNGDESAADLALCNMLAFWTGRDAERMDHLFRQSGLMRGKWDSKRRDTTYGAITIHRAIADCTETYKPATDPEILDDDPEPESTSVPALESESPTHERGWPTLHPEALIGLFGDLVRVLAPVTEADIVALLLHALVLFGSLVGRAPRMPIGRDLHHLNENVLLVGDTSTGRKGVALADVRSVMVDVDDVWGESCLVSGLSSGEGLIHAVRDATVKHEPITDADGRVTGYRPVTTDAGVSDKRLCCVESEFAKVLRVSRRDGSTLSAVLRQAWDSGDLRVLTRHSPVRATNAHVSVIGHITPRELRHEVRSADLANGFINRFLIALVRRSQLLPEGGVVDPAAHAELVRRFQRAAVHAEGVDTMARDADARAHWFVIYRQLTRARTGLVGAIANRAPAHVARLSCLYALADESAVIRLEHQKAAVAVWEYCETSATQIFGVRIGHRLSDYLLGLLRRAPNGLTRTQIRDACGRNRYADEISEALQLLEEYGLARSVKSTDGTGRPTTRWMADNATT